MTFTQPHGQSACSTSGQALLEVLKKQKPAGILYLKKDKIVKHKGVTLKISWERQGEEDILKDGLPRRRKKYIISALSRSQAQTRNPGISSGLSAFSR